MASIRPIGDKVLLMFPQSGRSDGGVTVVGHTLNRMDAVVVAKGNRVSDAIKVGDTVLADQEFGMILGIDGVWYRVVPEKDILAWRDIQCRTT